MSNAFYKQLHIIREIRESLHMTHSCNVVASTIWRTGAVFCRFPRMQPTPPLWFRHRAVAMRCRTLAMTTSWRVVSVASNMWCRRVPLSLRWAAFRWHSCRFVFNGDPVCQFLHTIYCFFVLFPLQWTDSGCGQCIYAGKNDSAHQIAARGSSLAIESEPGHCYWWRQGFV